MDRLRRGDLGTLCCLGLVSLLWGSSWLADATIGQQLTPWAVLALRYLLATAVLLPAWLLPGKLRLSKSMLLGCTLFALPAGLLFFGSAQGAGSLAALVGAALPLGLSVAAGSLSTASLVGLGAVLFLLNGSWPASSHAALGAVPLAAGVALQGWSLLQLKRDPGLGSARSLAIQCATAAAVFLVAAGVQPQALRGVLALSPSAWIAEALVAVLGTALAYMLYYRALDTLAPQQVAVTKWLQTLVTVAESAVVAAARPPLSMYLAAVVLLWAAVAVLRARDSDTAPHTLLPR